MNTAKEVTLTDKAAGRVAVGVAFPTSAIPEPGGFAGAGALVATCNSLTRIGAIVGFGFGIALKTAGVEVRGAANPALDVAASPPLTSVAFSHASDMIRHRPTAASQTHSASPRTRMAVRRT